MERHPPSNLAKAGNTRQSRMRISNKCMTLRRRPHRRFLDRGDLVSECSMKVSAKFMKSSTSANCG
jgi:hypothetical protein